MQIQSQPEWNMQRYASVQPGLGFSPFPASQAVPGKSAAAELQLSGSEVKQNNKPDKPQDEFQAEKREGGHGDASTWMSLYKFCGPLVAGIGYGAVFGSPIAFAAGVSLIVSSLQAGIALKIHKEDTPWAKSIVHSTRKLMGREKDHSAAGKEWSMVPVWGAVCALAGLVEASINHTFAYKYPPQSSAVLRQKTGFFKHIFKLQAWSMDWVKKKKDFLAGDKFKKLLPKMAEKWPEKLLSKFGNKVQGNAKLGYLAGIGIAGIGGMIQSASAAKIQEHLDAKNAAKKQGHPAGKEQAQKSEDGKNKPTEPEKNPEKPVKLPENKDDQEKKPEKRRDDEAALSTQVVPSSDGQSSPDEQQPAKSGAEQAKLTQPKLTQKSEQAKPEPAKSGQAKKPESKPDSETVSYVVQPQPMQPLMWPQPNSVIQPAPISKVKKDEVAPSPLKSGNPWPMRTGFITPYQGWLPANCARPYPQVVSPV